MKTDNYASEADTQELIRIGKLPTALALAEGLEKTMQWPLHGKAADELRRLHAANLDCMNHFEAVKAERDELLAALRRILPFVDCCAAISSDDIKEFEAANEAASAAIVKAEAA
jgi:hypothetical protein